MCILLKDEGKNQPFHTEELQFIRCSLWVNVRMVRTVKRSTNSDKFEMQMLVN